MDFTTLSLSELLNLQVDLNREINSRRVPNLDLDAVDRAILRSVPSQTLRAKHLVDKHKIPVAAALAFVRSWEAKPTQD